VTIRYFETFFLRATTNSATNGKLSSALVLLSILVILGAGCSKEKKALAEIQQSYDKKEYREAIALCKHAIRRNIDSPEVYYYYGKSLVSLNRDFEGFRRLDEAIRQDPSAGSRISNFLYLAAVRSFQKNQRAKAARRMQKAKDYNSSLKLGVYGFLVAESYYLTKEYAKAAHLYREAIRAYPDSSVVEEAYLNMADAYGQLGAQSRARESLEELLGLYPRGKYKNQARWRLVNLLYEEGEKHFLLGNYEEVVELIKDLIKTTKNPGLIQKSRFLLGETYEALGEFDSAYQQYRDVIRGDRGASGRIVERAREKIQAFKEAGLY
jgi:tetratricopeptide (TPR) repeat protein